MRVLTIAILFALAVSAQTPPKLVFQAIDAKTGAIIRGLQPEDLEVVEGDSIRPLSSLYFGAGPLDMVLVLDIGPHAVEIARTVARGARLACSELDPEDRLAFITFASSLKLRFPFTAGGGELGRHMERAADSSSWSRSIKVYDAIRAAIDLFPSANDPGRVRSVLVITNSLDQGSSSDLAAVRSAAKSKHIALFAVAVVTPWAGVYQERRLGPPAALVAERLRPVAEATGGEARVRELSGYLLRESFERVRSRYVATYTPAPGAAGTPIIRLTARGAVAFSNVAIRGVW